MNIGFCILILVNNLLLGKTVIRSANFIRSVNEHCAGL